MTASSTARPNLNKPRSVTSVHKLTSVWLGLGTHLFYQETHMSDSTQNPPSGDPGDPGTPPPPPAGPPTGGYMPPAPETGPGMANGGVGQPADLLMRFLARLIDFVLLGIAMAIINFA